MATAKKTWKGKTDKTEYKVKRVVIYKDGSNKIMIGTRSQFRQLWQSDKSIEKVWRISWWKRKQMTSKPPDSIPAGINQKE